MEEGVDREVIREYRCCVRGGLDRGREGKKTEREERRGRCNFAGHVDEGMTTRLTSYRVLGPSMIG